MTSQTCIHVRALRNSTDLTPCRIRNQLSPAPNGLLFFIKLESYVQQTLPVILELMLEVLEAGVVFLCDYNYLHICS